MFYLGIVLFVGSCVIGLFGSIYSIFALFSPLGSLDGCRVMYKGEIHTILRRRSPGLFDLQDSKGNLVKKVGYLEFEVLQGKNYN